MPRLKNIDPVEVSFVPKGANKKKFFLIKELIEMEEEILKSILELELKDEEKIDELLKAKGLSEKAQKAVKSALKLLMAYEDELPKDILKTLGGLAGYGYAEPEQYPEPKKKAEDEDLPPELKEKLEALWKEREELRKALEEEREARITKEFQEKAAQFKHIPEKTEVVAELLKSISRALPEEYPKLENILKAMDEQIDKGALFAEFGKSQEAEQSAWAKIESLANSIIEKDSKFTKEQAIAKVLSEHPELYEEYLKEVR